MKSVYKCALGLLLLGSASANASTILSPTDGDVNFLDFDDSTISWSYQVYMFDDSAAVPTVDLSTMDSLVIPIPSIVGIAGPIGSGDYLATNELAQTLSLGGSDNFIVAVLNLDTNEWVRDTGIVSLGANAARIMFEYNDGENSSLLGVDIQTSAVPLPGAAWLFGAGLIGLAGIVRRRKA